jgi:prepilin-type N-terminal cleavage/methylation domain-containing protein
MKSDVFSARNRLKTTYLRLSTSTILQGFTLIELAVVLAVAAALGTVIWRLYPAMRSSATIDVPAAALDEAKLAIEGFVLRTHRLPCPAPQNNTDGIENCAGNRAVGAIPFATLGLSATPALRTLRYGVYRNADAMVSQDADLAALKRRYAPLRPDTSVPISGNSNGLDFCVGLKNAINMPTTLSANADGMPVAYVIAHPGQNGSFDGVHTTLIPAFEFAGKPASSSYDDRVAAIGMGEVFARLNCVERLSAANSSVRALYAAYDTDRVAQQYADYRVFVERVRLNSKNFAAVALAQAIVDGAIAAVGAQAAATLTAATGGGAAAVIAPAAAAITVAALALAGATAAEISAELAYITAQNQRTAAANHIANVTAPALARAVALATLEINRGLVK